MKFMLMMIAVFVTMGVVLDRLNFAAKVVLAGLILFLILYKYSIF